MCKGCGNKSTNSEPFKDMSLKISLSIEDSIFDYLAQERLEIDKKGNNDLYDCSSCKKKTKAIYKTKL
jgi:hypothetical protein